MKSKILALVTMALAGMASGAHATAVDWTFTDIALTDGGTVSGSFVFDADSVVYSDVNITTTAGSAFGGATYTYPSPIVGENVAFLWDAQPGPIETVGAPNLFMSFTPSLTDAGGTVSAFFSEGPCAPGYILENGCHGFYSKRTGTGDIVGTPVPEPATLSLLGLGLVGVGVMRRRNTR